MSQVAIICIFEVDTLVTSRDGLANEVLETLQDAGMPIVTAHAYKAEDGGGVANLGANAAMLAATANSQLTPPTPPPAAL